MTEDEMVGLHHQLNGHEFGYQGLPHTLHSLILLNSHNVPLCSCEDPAWERFHDLFKLSYQHLSEDLHPGVVSLRSVHCTVPAPWLCLRGDPLLIATGVSIPLRGLEGIPGASQDEAVRTRKFEMSHGCGGTC